MKILTVFVCISVSCVCGYTIFPLPGQRVAVNPKFGKLDVHPLSSAQSVTATNVVPYSSTLPQLSTSYQTPRVPEVTNPPTPAPLKPLLVSSYQTSKAPEIGIPPTPSTLSSYSYASSSEASKPSSLAQNVQSPPSIVVNPLAEDLLPPHESSVPETKPDPLEPIKPEIEAPSKDLLPPKLR